MMGKREHPKSSHRCIWCHAAINRYKTGMRVAEIARAIDRGEEQIRRILRIHDILLTPRTDRAPWADDAIAARLNDHLTLEQIGRRVGKTRERVRQVLTQRGIDTKATGRGHHCNRACAVLLAATPPVLLSALGRLHGIPYNVMLYARRYHPIETTRARHVCDARCEIARSVLAEGGTFAAVYRATGFHPGPFQQRFAVYHPDWNWSRLRQRTSAEAVVGASAEYAKTVHA